MAELETFDFGLQVKCRATIDRTLSPDKAVISYQVQGVTIGLFNRKAEYTKSKVLRTLEAWVREHAAVLTFLAARGIIENAASAAQEHIDSLKVKPQDESKSQP